MELQPFSDERLDVYLASRPRGGGGIYLAILTLLLGAVSALPLVRVPVFLRAEGTLRPLEDSQRIIAPSGGRVLSGGLTPGQPVAAGDTLLRLVDSALQSHQQALILRIRELESEIGVVRAHIAETGAGSVSPLMSLRPESEFDAPGDELQLLTNREDAAGSDVARGSFLHAGNLLESPKVVSLEGRLDEARLNRMRATFGWRAELAALEREKLTLAAAAAAVAEELRSLTITAPCDGVIGDRVPLVPGSHVVSGEVVATLIPSAPLVAVAYVQPWQLQAMAPGERVTIRSGSHLSNGSTRLPGTVVRVGPALLSSDEGMVGEVRVLPVGGDDPERAKAMGLRSGMPVSVLVPLGRQPLWAMLRGGGAIQESHEGGRKLPGEV